jgi:glycosyltransferase involved in cell wall biosynthesis
MAKHRKKHRQAARSRTQARTDAGFERLYERACQRVGQGGYRRARRLYESLAATAPDSRRQAIVANDLAALAACSGDLAGARAGFEGALTLDEGCERARANLALLGDPESDLQQPAPGMPPAVAPAQVAQKPDAIRVAVVSFLFNWPSTGGGIVHTVELARFLAEAGYEVKHFFAQHLPWGVGAVKGALPYPAEALVFDEPSWNLPAIQARFRQAVERFAPDHVIITDSWNIKPLLAEAVRDFPYILRFQAMECLCPLNNVRLLPDGAGGFRQCTRHQLANPETCAGCVRDLGHYSGGLHQAERALSGVGTADYHARLRRALQEAEAVLVVNPLQEAMFSPYAECVRVVTSGFDPARFPWPYPEPKKDPTKTVLLFAGLVDEVMKGFAVLHAACSRLWQQRQDFELVATADPPGRLDAFTRLVGWQSQEDLPRQIRAADVLVVPTVAQEALGRTAVEAMGAGRPVIASRLGGLSFTVADGATGLLCEPGDPEDLARKITLLLDDPGLRRRLGEVGRRRFEEQYAWPVIIDRHYRPLLRRSRAARC